MTKDIVIRADGRKEWICEHGVGHTFWSPKRFGDSGFVHGCDGCCKSERYKELYENHSPEEQTKSEHLKVHKDKSNHTNNGETLCSTRLLGVTRKNKTAPADTSIIDACRDDLLSGFNNWHDDINIREVWNSFEELKQRIAEVLDEEFCNPEAVIEGIKARENGYFADEEDEFIRYRDALLKVIKKELKQKLIGGKRT